MVDMVEMVEMVEMVAMVEMVEMVEIVDMVEMIEMVGMKSRLFGIGPVAQWIRHRPTEPGIAGSSPAGVMLSQVPSDRKVEC